MIDFEQNCSKLQMIWAQVENVKGNRPLCKSFSLPKRIEKSPQKVRRDNGKITINLSKIRL